MEPQPLPMTARGGKIMVRMTRQILMKLVLVEIELYCIDLATGILLQDTYFTKSF